MDKNNSGLIILAKDEKHREKIMKSLQDYYNKLIKQKENETSKKDS